MEIFAISGLVNGSVAVGFGLLVILKNWRNRVNQLYFLMTISLAIWSFYYWLWLSSTDYDTALNYVQLLSAGSLFIPVFFFHWIVTYLNQERSHRIILILAYLLSISILFFYKSELFISGLSQKLYFTFWPSAGIIYDLYFSLIYVGLVLFSWLLLFRARKDRRYESKRGPILYLIIGSLIGFGGGFTNFPLWFGLPIPPYGNFLIAIFPFTFFYSMYKYKLFSTKTLTTEIGVFLLAEILLVKTVLSNSLTELILQAILFLLVSFFGIIIVRSVYKEIQQREKIEKLAGDLARANKNLATANDRLKEVDQLKSEFVSLATHQIRGPLSAIKGYASLVLEGDYGKLTEKLNDPLEKIYKSSQSLIVIVEDFLNISRIELGRMKYDFTRINLSALITELVAELKPNIESKGLSTSIKIEKDVEIVADDGKIKQVFANLIDNAIKYTKEGTVTISLDCIKGKAHFAVKDHGIGMNKDTIPKLFQKFSRAKDASKTNIMGTGLGLYVASEIVKAHHGRIWAESDGEGKGSTFRVELDCK